MIALVPHPPSTRDLSRAGSLRLLFVLAAFPVLASGLRSPLSAQLPTPDGAVEREVSRARRSIPRLGVHVVELAEGREVAAWSPDRLLIPASNEKLLTTSAALALLGPGHRFETRLLARGPVDENGVLRGDLAVVGGGDPGLSGRSFDGDDRALFRRWAEALRAAGIDAVAGDLYLVDGLFEGPEIHPDWKRDQLHRCYESPISALAYNDNCLHVRLWPGTTPGSAVVAESVPGHWYGEIALEAVTSSRPVTDVVIDRWPGGEVVSVKGRLGWGPFDGYVAVADPAAFFGTAMRGALREEGVPIAGGSWQARRVPPGQWRTVASRTGDLFTAVEVTNKRSHNFTAEVLFKHLGRQLCGEGSWEAGGRAVAAFLDDLGVPREGLVAADGSGLSRESRVSPRQITGLLAAMYRHRRGPELLRSLPFGGEEDTSLEKRFEEPPYRGNVVAKTGTLDGVAALSGYAKGRSGRLYAFSILANGAPVWRARVAIDRIVEALVDEG